MSELEKAMNAVEEATKALNADFFAQQEKRVKEGASRIRRLEAELTIKQLEAELTEANEMLASIAQKDRKLGRVQLMDRFDPELVVTYRTLSYWHTLIERHITDEKFTSFNHAITHLIDNYPNRNQ